MLAKQNLLQSPSNLTFFVLMNSTFGGVITTLKNFLMFLHSIITLTKAFTFVQEKVKKGISTHIKEIQAFQNYFETAYRPDDLSQTVYDATLTLKEKFTKKWNF